MSPEDIANLLERYRAGTATTDERAVVESWYINYKPVSPQIAADQIAEDQQQSLDLLLSQISQKPVKRFWPRFAAAASILVLFCAGGYYFAGKNAHQAPRIAISNPIKHDAAPGGNKAVITLANGANVVLNGAKNGTIAYQGKIVIKKTADGKITYSGAEPNASANTIAYNTATTPRGGQYQFILADGTKVWLNAASSIKYPVVFKGSERKVELTGEAYFEVAHNAKMPFRVVSNNQTVEVLGTHFNINAYSNEDAVKTTLAEGSVKVITASGSEMIKPGQQAQFANGKVSVTDVDINEALAWKNGFFFFRDNNIEEVMRQLSRWYDVDVQYDGKLPSRQFSGEISRNVNASQILEILSFKKIRFTIEGKTIIVKQ